MSQLFVHSPKNFGGAVATIESFTADGLFVGQSKKFLDRLMDMAADADAARREDRD
jgi:hypothetical protein